VTQNEVEKYTPACGEVICGTNTSLASKWRGAANERVKRERKTKNKVVKEVMIMMKVSVCSQSRGKLWWPDESHSMELPTYIPLPHSAAFRRSVLLPRAPTTAPAPLPEDIYLSHPLIDLLLPDSYAFLANAVQTLAENSAKLRL
jgi:hypothetical protein